MALNLTGNQHIVRSFIGQEIRVKRCVSSSLLAVFFAIQGVSDENRTLKLGPNFYICSCSQEEECNDKLIFSTAETPVETPIILLILVPQAILAIVLLSLFYFCYAYSLCPSRLKQDFSDTHSIDTIKHQRSDSVSNWLNHNTKLLPIQLEEMVGKGRFAEVYRARLKSAENGVVQMVAVKIFPLEEFLSWNTEHEIFLDPELSHENIVHFLAAEKHIVKRQLWLITAFHTQGNLRDYLRENQLEWEEFCKMGGDVVRGVAHLHSDRTAVGGVKTAIAHRDLKSDNVLVKDDRSCCICDFGLSIRLDSDMSREELANSGQVGTVRYMAPELLESRLNLENIESFKQADVYSMALLLWEITSRCSANGDLREYKPPFGRLHHPCIESMKDAVIRNQERPEILPSWRTHPSLLPPKTNSKLPQTNNPLSQTPAPSKLTNSSQTPAPKQTPSKTNYCPNNHPTAPEQPLSTPSQNYCPKQNPKQNYKKCPKNTLKQTTAPTHKTYSSQTPAPNNPHKQTAKPPTLTTLHCPLTKQQNSQNYCPKKTTTLTKLLPPKQHTSQTPAPNNHSHKNSCPKQPPQTNTLTNTAPNTTLTKLLPPTTLTNSHKLLPQTNNTLTNYCPKQTPSQTAPTPTPQTTTAPNNHSHKLLPKQPLSQTPAPKTNTLTNYCPKQPLSQNSCPKQHPHKTCPKQTHLTNYSCPKQTPSQTPAPNNHSHKLPPQQTAPNNTLHCPNKHPHKNCPKQTPHYCPKQPLSQTPAPNNHSHKTPAPNQKPLSHKLLPQTTTLTNYCPKHTTHNYYCIAPKQNPKTPTLTNSCPKQTTLPHKLTNSAQTPAPKQPLSQTTAPNNPSQTPAPKPTLNKNSAPNNHSQILPQTTNPHKKLLPQTTTLTNYCPKQTPSQNNSCPKTQPTLTKLPQTNHPHKLLPQTTTPPQQQTKPHKLLPKQTTPSQHCPKQTPSPTAPNKHKPHKLPQTKNSCPKQPLSQNSCPNKHPHKLLSNCPKHTLTNSCPKQTPSQPTPAPNNHSHKLLPQTTTLTLSKLLPQNNHSHKLLPQTNTPHKLPTKNLLLPQTTTLKTTAPTTTSQTTAPNNHPHKLLPQTNTLTNSCPKQPLSKLLLPKQPPSTTTTAQPNNHPYKLQPQTTPLTNYSTLPQTNTLTNYCPKQTPSQTTVTNN
ncbi:TGF-beta receptor type-2 [Bagarius yarrelli]|uniref:receptor protein serine/threonine kinase n=1 Tax=Bagarius yarrelli TaxID=175774 RepID=A0A556VXN2_BAGYA|nr:TGF-beta receptor type-2 [Bagarius yarrelli]